MSSGGTARPRPLLEICVEDVHGALAAVRAGADRVEYCANLAVGGVTPSMEEVQELLEQLGSSGESEQSGDPRQSAQSRGLGVQILIRSRDGDFVYNEGEISQMCDQIQQFREATQESPITVGFVVGAITADGSLDEGACQRFREVAGGKPLTFHRAFDELTDPIASAVWLAEHGYNRILTTGLGVPETQSGGLVSSVTFYADRIVERGYNLAGLATLQRAVDEHGLKILASGGLRPETWDKDLLTQAALQEFHLRAPWAEGDTVNPADGKVNPAVVRVMRRLINQP